MISWVIRSTTSGVEIYHKFDTRREARIFKRKCKRIFTNSKFDMFKVSSVDLWEGDIISAYLEKAY